MRSANIRRELAREVLEAVRARLRPVIAADPAEMTSSLTVRETLEFVRTLRRYSFDTFEEE